MNEFALIVWVVAPPETMCVTVDREPAIVVIVG